VRAIPHYSKGAKLEDGSKGADPMKTDGYPEAEVDYLLVMLAFANKYLAKAVADGLMEDCVLPCSTAHKRIKHVLAKYGC
jgi:hypothetical protein